MLIARGLGAINPSAVANTQLIKDQQSGGSTASGGVESSHAGGFSITQHHWQTIVEESYYPGFLDDYRNGRDVNGAAYRAAFQNAVRALTLGLPQCDPAALTDGGTSCYFGRFVPITSWQSRPEEVGLLPPGVFAVYAVPFGVNELANGKFTRTFVPSPQQRREMEHAIIRASHLYLFGSKDIHNPDRRPLFGDALIAGKLSWLRSRNKYTFPQRPSVNFVLEACPDIMLYAVNFLRNPIQPTPTERTSDGGWESWIARGGYPLSRAIVTGQKAVSDPIGLQVCAGLECVCPSTGNNAGFPSCYPVGINKSGSASAGGAWWPYIAIPQDVVRPEMQLSLVYDDPAWITKVGEVGQKILTALAEATCANQGFTREYLANQMKPKYLDASGKTCTKGSPGCKEISPSTTSQVGVGIFNGIMMQWCSGWSGQNLPDPLVSLPPVAPIPTPEPTRIPWWLVVLGGIGVGGAAAFSRRTS